MGLIDGLAFHLQTPSLKLYPIPAGVQGNTGWNIRILRPIFRDQLQPIKDSGHFVQILVHMAIYLFTS